MDRRLAGLYQTESYFLKAWVAGTFPVGWKETEAPFLDPCLLNSPLLYFEKCILFAEELGKMPKWMVRIPESPINLTKTFLPLIVTN